MSLSRAQVQLIANSGLFNDAIKRALAALDGFAPLLWHLALTKQRDRSRVVTRRKQRNRW